MAANEGQEVGLLLKPCHCRFPGRAALGGFVKGCCLFGERGSGKSGGCAGSSESGHLGRLRSAARDRLGTLRCSATRRQEQHCSAPSEPPELDLQVQPTASYSQWAPCHRLLREETPLACTGQSSHSLQPKHYHHCLSARQTLAERGLISSMEAASSALTVPELTYQAGITLFLKASSPLAESKGNPSSPAPSWCCFTAVLHCLKDLLLFYFFGCRIYCPH